MERSKALSLLAAGEKALDLYDGASSAWSAMKTGKTASQLMSVGAEKLGVVPRSSGELAIAALFGAVVAVLFVKGK